MEEILLRKELSLVPKLSNHPSGCSFLLLLVTKVKINQSQKLPKEGYL